MRLLQFPTPLRVISRRSSSGPAPVERFTAHDLERWLCGPTTDPLPAHAVTVLGVPPDHPSLLAADAAARRKIRFILAVLRDVYPTDAGVSRWLRTPVSEAGGRSPLDLLHSAQLDQLAELATREWNASLTQ